MQIDIYQGLISIVLLAGLGSCASGKPGTYEPVVDMKGINAADYQRDLAECRVYSDDLKVAESAATGAAGGAVIGGVLGAVLADGDFAKRTAAAGAVTGGLQGGGRALSERRSILRNCLLGRGYRVLN